MRKTNNIIFWASTVLVSLMMLFSAYSYITSEEIKGAFMRLGFPGYFRVELAIAKIIGAIILLAPSISKSIKQLAYFGFALTFVSAIIAHLFSGDQISMAIAPLIILVILTVSYIYYNRITGVITI